MHMGVGGGGISGRFPCFGAFAACCIMLAGCAGSSNLYSKQGVGASVSESDQPVSSGSGYYHLGKPYVVAGHIYVPASNPNYSVVGLASWYGSEFHGRHTANGEIFDENAISAAHPTLPLPCYVRVTNLANQKSIVVRVNDRGPFAFNRVIDLSKKTAQLLGFYSQGVAKVKVDYIGSASLTNLDNNTLVHSLREDAFAEPVQTPSKTSSASNGVNSILQDNNRTSVGSNKSRIVNGFNEDATDALDKPGTNILMNSRGLY
jgi:peptidoglycan lytic transglycosylase